MKSDYSDYHDLILVGYAAMLTPAQIYRRFIDGGLPQGDVPSAADIRVIGCSLIGPACRWRNSGHMTVWRSGVVERGLTDHLALKRKTFF